MPDLSFHDAIRLPVFWTTAWGMLCAMWTYPAVLEQLQPALLAEGLESAGAQLWPCGCHSVRSISPNVERIRLWSEWGFCVRAQRR